MDKEKFIKYLKSACAEPDGLAQSDVHFDNFIEKGFFDKKED